MGRGNEEERMGRKVSEMEQFQRQIIENKSVGKLLHLQLNFMSEDNQRTLSSCSHKVSGTNCKKCGLYIHEANQALKSNLFDSYLNCSADKYLGHLRKRQAEVLEAREIGEGTWLVLQGVCEKFEYSLETLALGLYIFAKTYHKQEKDEKFWAATALLVASKAIQLDKRVPYLNRYQKYAEKSFPQQEYQEAERTIFEEMSYNLQMTTFVSFLHFYLTNGVLFQKDGLYFSNVRAIEDQLLHKAKEMMKNAAFLGYEPEKLALSLVKEVRGRHRLEPWTKELESLSGYKSEDIHSLQRSNILKPICTLSMRAKEKLCSLSQHNTLTSLQNSIQLTDNKPKLIRRRNDSVMKSNVKENTFRPPPQAHQNLLSSIRKQTLSVSKCPLQAFPISSNMSSFEKLAPLSFQTRRI